MNRVGQRAVEEVVLLISKPQLPWPDLEPMVDLLVRTVIMGTVPRA